VGIGAERASPYEHDPFRPADPSVDERLRERYGCSSEDVALWRLKVVADFFDVLVIRPLRLPNNNFKQCRLSEFGQQLSDTG
jgi:hypothetical protein